MTTQYSCYNCGRDIDEQTSDKYKAIAYDSPDVQCFCGKECRVANYARLVYVINTLDDDSGWFVVPINCVRDGDTIVAVDRDGQSIYGRVHDSVNGSIYGPEHIYWRIELETAEIAEFYAKYGRDFHDPYGIESCPMSDDSYDFNEGTLAWITRDEANIVLNEKLQLCSWFANVYEVDRAYGGPEEGGWWYDTGEIKLSVPCLTWDGAWEVAEKLRKLYPHTGKSSSVIYDGGDYSVMVQQKRGEDYPKHRMAYS